MKKQLSLLIACIMSASQLFGCPTCVGRLRLADEPFFAERFRNTIIHSDEDAQAYQELQEEFLQEEESLNDQ